TTYEQLDDPRPPGRPMVGPHVRPQKTDHAPKNGHGGGPQRPAGTSNVQCNAATENASPPPSQAEREVAQATGDRTPGGRPQRGRDEPGCAEAGARLLHRLAVACAAKSGNQTPSACSGVCKTDAPGRNANKHWHMLREFGGRRVPRKIQRRSAQ